MTRLLIANDTPNTYVANNFETSAEWALWAMLILWHMKDDDIVVLPQKPDHGHLEYVAKLTGTRLESLRIIVAPPGMALSLSADRITNKELLKSIKDSLGGRSLQAVVPIALDGAVAHLAHSLGVKNSLPGADFAFQGGGILANSKAIFRAIAAGASVPTPPGFVLSDMQQAEIALCEMLLVQGVPVIVKKDFAQGCRGNEVLSPTEGTLQNGARRAFVLPDIDSIRTYLSENWLWLTNNGRNSFVVERYFPGSIAIFAEFNLSDQGVNFSGLGEMLAVPVADAEVIPPIGLSPHAIALIVDGGRRLSEAMHKIGYRGNLSADAIVSADGKVFFSEYNGRITGSTHIYSAIGERIVGKNWVQSRILVERRGWIAPSFEGAVRMLNDSGLAYNHETKTGFILSGTFIKTLRVISYTVIAKNLEEAVFLEKKLHEISPRSSS